MTTSVKAPRLFRTLNENPTHIKINSTRAGERSFLRANGFTTVLPHAMMGILGHASGKLRFAAPENERFFADSKKPRYELDSRTGSPGNGITGVEWNGSQVRMRVGADFPLPSCSALAQEQLY